MAAIVASTSLLREWPAEVRLISKSSPPKLASIKYPVLVEELAKRGWTDEALGKLAGENFLRVLREVEARAGR